MKEIPSEKCGIYSQFFFPDRPIPSVNCIRNTINVLKKTGSVQNSKNKINQEVDNENREDFEITVCAAVEENPYLSLNDLADLFNISRSAVRRILKKNGYSSFKLRVTHELLPGDYFRRMFFCEEMIERLNENPDFARNILFTDESCFPLFRRHNPAITRYWSRENKHIHVVGRTQYPQKVNVWAGILGNRIIGPFFYNGNLTTERYLDLLQNQVLPAIQDLPNFNQIWFMQDGCPVHNSRAAREFLNLHFPNRWIGTNGIIRWPPRSPDLTTQDYFYWGYLKTSVYAYPEERAANVEELQHRITEISNTITPEMLTNVLSEFYNRLGYCLAEQGGLFEHLL